MAFPVNLKTGLKTIQTNLIPDRRDLLDWKGTNTIQTSRYIDPITHDFVVSATNHLVGMNYVDQEVVIALNTSFNSSVLLGFGQNFLSPKLITTSIKTQLYSLLQQCLSFQIQNGLVVIQSFDVSNTASGQMSFQFTYINTTTNTTVQQQFQL